MGHRDWIHNWSIHRVASVIKANKEYLYTEYEGIPFSIHKVIRLINLKYPCAHAYYTGYGSKIIRQGLNLLVDEGVLRESFRPARKTDGWVTETFYSFKSTTDGNV